MFANRRHHKDKQVAEGCQQQIEQSAIGHDLEQSAIGHDLSRATGWHAGSKRRLVLGNFPRPGVCLL